MAHSTTSISLYLQLCKFPSLFLDFLKAFFHAFRGSCATKCFWFLHVDLLLFLQTRFKSLQNSLFGELPSLYYLLSNFANFSQISLAIYINLSEANFNSNKNKHKSKSHMLVVREMERCVYKLAASHFLHFRCYRFFSDVLATINRHKIHSLCSNVAINLRKITSNDRKKNRVVNLLSELATQFQLTQTFINPRDEWSNLVDPAHHRETK